MEDHELAAAAAGGDQRAFATLAERYRRYIYAIAWRIVMDEEEALDIAQEVLLKMARRIGQWRGEGSFRSWLGSMTSRTALDELRRPCRRETPVDPLEWTESAEPVGASRSASPVEIVQATERRALVGKAMALLTPQQRAILIMRLDEELKPVEIAERLGLKPAQVRSQLSRAISRLREELAE
ncbi:sigma-70 family RNA polymerase sigma factor [bacterium]|nr:sigma-70 family RNA polymerase sigma factor [bacterium]